MEEIWKTIEDYPNYMVSNMGRVKSLRGKGKILKIKKEKNGYIRINLYKKGVNKHFSVHRLVAQAFIPNPENKPQIDHINTNRTDNRVEKLRWVTRIENMNNPLTIIKKSGENNPKPWLGKFSKKHPNSISILQFDLNNNFIKKWYSIADIERELNFNHSFISICCSNKRKTAYGYIWQYADDYERIPFKVFDLEIYRKKAV